MKNYKNLETKIILNNNGEDLDLISQSCLRINR